VGSFINNVYHWVKEGFDDLWYSKGKYFCTRGISRNFMKEVVLKIFWMAKFRGCFWNFFSKNPNKLKQISVEGWFIIPWRRPCFVLKYSSQVRNQGALGDFSPLCPKILQFYRGFEKTNLPNFFKKPQAFWCCHKLFDVAQKFSQ